MIQKNKEKNLKYSIGSIRVEGIEPSKEFLDFAEKEKKGEITDQYIKSFFNEKYKIKG